MRKYQNPGGSEQRPRKKQSTASVLASRGSGKSFLPGLLELDLNNQRLALLLIEAIHELADETDIPESEVRNVVNRVLQTGLLQRSKADDVRHHLARLVPSLRELDPVPHATVEQAKRLAALKTSLLQRGAFPTSEIAKGRGTRRDAARQWITRARRQNRLFTVTHDGETLVPAFLLDNELEPRSEVQQSISALRKAGEDGWSLWAWFVSPSPWLDGEVPLGLLDFDPERVREAALQRAHSAE